MTKNIVLVGFMGAGKSLTARCLGLHLKRKVVSTDAEIEKQERRSVVKIFEDSGEEYFRSIESQIVQKLSLENNLIIDCGGGVAVSVDNIRVLKQGGIVFYLATSPEYVHERTKRSGHRPLLNVANPVEKIRELLKEREPFYKQADHILDTDGKTVEQSCQEVLEIVQAQRT